MRICLNDVKTYNRQFENQCIESTRSILRSGSYILGDTLASFERDVAAYLGVKYCVGVASGTDALEVAFKLLNLSETDEIIIQANAYIACAFGAIQSKASLRIIDCAKDATFDIDAFEAAISPKTKAVLVVHLYGDCCDMERLSKMCKDKSIYLIEDCAQSFGSGFNGKKLGSFGDMSCHSFYPTKNLGAIGDAGAICTNNDTFAAQAKIYRNLGCPAKYVNTMKGTNARMDPLQASYLAIKLPHLDDMIRKKRDIAVQYELELAYPHVKNTDKRVYSSYHLFVIYVGQEQRDALGAHLAKQDIETIIHYPIPFFKSEAFTEYNHLSFPNAERLSNSILSIPMHCLLTDDEVRKIILHINAFKEDNEAPVSFV
jgi:dTDP-4-amino-4,6-dideoxygalactose transaminase